MTLAVVSVGNPSPLYKVLVCDTSLFIIIFSRLHVKHRHKARFNRYEALPGLSQEEEKTRRISKR